MTVKSDDHDHAPGREAHGRADALAPAEAALFRRVIEDSAFQGVIIQQDGRIVYANRAMARLFGYDSPADMIGLNPFEDLIVDGSIDEFRIRTAAVLRGEEVRPHPGWQARHRAARFVWMTSTAHLSEWQGKPAVASFYFDITERYLAEQAVQESEARYRSALAAGRMGAWETDLVAGTRKWTPEGMVLFGLDLPEGRGVVGGDADELVAAMHPADRGLIPGSYEIADREDSFPAEYRIVRPDGAMVWVSGRGRVLKRGPGGKAQLLVSVMADITERKATELHVKFLMREMSHRSKNLLAVIQSVARQTASRSDSLADFLARFSQRLESLAASHDLLTSNDWKGVPLGDLVRQQLAPFIGRDSGRITVSGPDLELTSDAAQTLGLAIHELATNAIKHGALSRPSGRISLTWQLSQEAGGSRRVDLRWVEQGGPEVTPPTRRGFGHVVLERMTASALEGAVDIDFAPAGLVWSLSFPLRRPAVGA